MHCLHTYLDACTWTHAPGHSMERRRKKGRKIKQGKEQGKEREAARCSPASMSPCRACALLARVYRTYYYAYIAPLVRLVADARHALASLLRTYKIQEVMLAIFFFFFNLHIQLIIQNNFKLSRTFWERFVKIPNISLGHQGTFFRSARLNKIFFIRSTQIFLIFPICAKKNRFEFLNLKIKQLHDDMMQCT